MIHLEAGLIGEGVCLWKGPHPLCIKNAYNTIINSGRVE